MGRSHRRADAGILDARIDIKEVDDAVDHLLASEPLVELSCDLKAGDHAGEHLPAVAKLATVPTSNLNCTVEADLVQAGGVVQLRTSERIARRHNDGKRAKTKAWIAKGAAASEKSDAAKELLRLLKPTNETQSDTDTRSSMSAEASAGNAILGLLQINKSKEGASLVNSSRCEPLALSTDEFLLTACESREDAERGADRHNLDTFGEDVAPGGGAWNFDDMLEANRWLQEMSDQSKHCFTEKYSGRKRGSSETPAFAEQSNPIVFQ